MLQTYLHLVRSLSCFETSLVCQLLQRLPFRGLVVLVKLHNARLNFTSRFGRFFATLLAELPFLFDVRPFF